MIPTIQLLAPGYNEARQESIPKLSAKIIHACAASHRSVVNSEFFTKLKAHELTKPVYTQYLIDHFHIYQALEQAIQSHSSSNRIEPLSIPPLFRTEKIRADVLFLEGDLEKPSDSAINYKMHIQELSRLEPHRLIAHAAVHYLGDFFGGLRSKEHIEALFGSSATAFYDWEELCQEWNSAPQFLSKAYMKLLDQIPLTDYEEQAVIDEALVAYQKTNDCLNGLRLS